MSDRKVLHVAVRNDARTRDQEREEFRDLCGLEEHELVTLNTLETPEALKNGLSAYDALLIGGSSDVDVLDGADVWPWLPDLSALVREAYETGVPTFASCFGYQVAVDELGGVVAGIEAYAENAPSTRLELTEEGKGHWLCEGLPDTFYGVSIHKYSAESLPENVEVLIKSEAYPWHAIAFKEKPFFATQFHPEMNREDVLERMSWYKTRYWDSEASFNKACENVRAMPEANSVIRNFAKKYL